jgi:hypothetical protein
MCVQIHTTNTQTKQKLHKPAARDLPCARTELTPFPLHQRVALRFNNRSIAAQSTRTKRVSLSHQEHYPGALVHGKAAMMLWLLCCRLLLPARPRDPRRWAAAAQQGHLCAPAQPHAASVWKPPYLSLLLLHNVQSRLDDDTRAARSIP